MEAQEALLTVVRRSPVTYNYAVSRWSLQLLMEVCTWVKVETEQGFWCVMRRLKVHYKASCQYVHSPDMAYEAKWAVIEQVVQLALEPDVIVLCLDELTYYNQPSLAKTYALCGKEQTKAPRALGATKTGRVIGALNILTGQVIFEQKSTISVGNFIAFLAKIVALNPGKRIFILIDNWPIHYHPNVMAALEEQTYKHWFKIPESWQNMKLTKKYIGLNLPVQFVPLPTYASWLNPIEKLWRWLKQDVIHVHKDAENWQSLKDKISTFLQQFNELSYDLLNYVGLNNKNTKYGKILFNNSG